jgi:hypothetical protein
MPSYTEIVQSYQRAEAKYRRHILSRLLYGELLPQNAQALLLAAASCSSWDLFRRLLRHAHIREQLWFVINTLELSALNHDDLQEFYSSLPSPLSAHESDYAFSLPVSIKSWEMAKRIFSLDGYPSENTFRSVFNSYDSRAKSPFEFNFLVESVQSTGFDWRKALSFEPDDDYPIVLRRAAQSSNKSLYVVAFALMSKKEKCRYLKSLDSTSELYKVCEHMTLPVKWVSCLNKNVSSEFLSDQIGL